MGWPKGKPRKVLPPPPPTGMGTTGLENISAPSFGGSAYEPVTVKATLLSGKEVEFKAFDFDVVSGRYTFISIPVERGFKTVRLLRWDQLSMLEITAPEPMCDRLKEWVPPPVINAMTAVTEPPSGPIHYGNAHAAAIRNANLAGAPPPRYPADPRVPTAVDIPNAPGIPMSKISANEDGKAEVVGATLR